MMTDDDDDDDDDDDGDLKPYVRIWHHSNVNHDGQYPLSIT